MHKKKKKDEGKNALVVCIWCYSHIQPGEESTHPCIQPDFLDTQPLFNPHPNHPSVLSKIKNNTFSNWYAKSAIDPSWGYSDELWDDDDEEDQ